VGPTISLGVTDLHVGDEERPTPPKDARAWSGAIGTQGRASWPSWPDGLTKRELTWIMAIFGLVFLGQILIVSLKSCPF
jgi:hypothetical protein